MDINLNRPESLEAFGAALRRRREELGMTLDELAGKTGISKPYLSNIETARAPGPASEEKLRRVAAALKWDEEVVVAAGDWLRTPESVRRMIGGGGPRRQDGAGDLDAGFRREAGGKGSASKYAQRSPRPSESGTRSSEILSVREVPVINRVPAGKAAEFGDMNYPAGVADEYVPAPDLPGAPVKSAFALKIVGDSMMPEYAEGEIIIVGPGEAVDGDDCVVRLGEGENFATTFKRVFFVRDEKGEATGVRLVALNPKYAEQVVGVEGVSGVYPLMYWVSPAKRGQGPAPSQTAGFEGEGRERGDFTSRVSIEHD